MEDILDDVAEVVDRIVGRKGRDLKVALPLGIGKPNHIVNELTRRAAAGELDRLEFFTALSLSRPSPGSSELERRLMGPILDRLYGDFPDLEYVVRRAHDDLPDNIVVTEFYYPPGSLLGSEHAQRHYKCVNFTEAYRDMQREKVDVIAQLVTRGSRGWDLSSNPDISLELMPKLATRPEDERPFLVAQVNENLPRMGGSGEVEFGTFDAVLDNRELDFGLFSLPSMPPTDGEYAVGLRVAAMLRDGGTVQIGIGNQGDSVAWSAILRHRDPALFGRMLNALDPTPSEVALVDRIGGRTPFELGLYAGTEMFVEGLLHMYRAGVLKREVDGVVLHGGFFLGSEAFYEALRALTDEDRERLAMTSVLWTNLLHGDEEKKRGQRQHARFINEGMMVTATGGIVSDGLEDGRVVSGVGGQYEFVAQAHALDDAHAILMIPAVRAKAGKVSSNIRWSYGHITIPRHLRDIVVTEYGVAQLRGKTDEEVVSALIEVADARFQDELVASAKAAKKLSRDYRVPDRARRNTPEAIRDAIAPFRRSGDIPRTPFGSSLTGVELDLAQALGAVKGLVDDTRAGQLPQLSIEGLTAVFDVPDAAAAHLERMGLADTDSMRDALLRAVVVYGLKSVNLI